MPSLLKDWGSNEPYNAGEYCMYVNGTTGMWNAGICNDTVPDLLCERDAIDYSTSARTTPSADYVATTTTTTEISGKLDVGSSLM